MLSGEVRACKFSVDFWLPGWECWHVCNVQTTDSPQGEYFLPYECDELKETVSPD
jgi:hypothetical protein